MAKKKIEPKRILKINLFEGDPIEYCLSIVVEDERVIINYSTWDRTTRIGVYDKKYIDSIVKYS